MSTPGGLFRGVLWGVLFWLTYGTVEFVFVSVLPVGKGLPKTLLSEWHWQFAGVAALIYVLIGAVAGLIARGSALLVSSVFNSVREAGLGGAAKRFAALSLVAAWTAHLALREPGIRARHLGLAVGVGMAIGLPLTAIPRRGKYGGAVLTDPVVVSVLLLGVPWICQQLQGLCLGPRGRVRRSLSY